MARSQAEGPHFPPRVSYWLRPQLSQQNLQEAARRHELLLPASTFSGREVAEPEKGKQEEWPRDLPRTVMSRIYRKETQYDPV